MNYHVSWPEDARRFLDKVVNAHGGHASWDKVHSITFSLKKFSGALLFAKGLNRTFQPAKKIWVYPKQRKVTFEYQDHVNSFENGKVTFSKEGKVIPDGRMIFRRSTFEQWSPAHATYFFGYAWANYISYPFILSEFELLSHELNSDNPFLEIKFPEGFHTHCRIQKFYFNKDHLLSRHDYHAELAGPLVYGAHSCSGYVEHQGVKIATIREVRPKMGSIVLPIYGIYGEIQLVSSLPTRVMG